MKSKYFLAALSAFAIWGLFSLVLKPMHVYRAVDILFYRVFTAGLLMLLFNMAFRRSVLRENLQQLRALPQQKQVITLLFTFAGGLLLVANWLFFIYVMNTISIRAASFAYLICPILTTVLAFFLLRERLTASQWAAVGLSFVSCALLAFNHLQDTLYSLVVAGSYALYLITQRRNGGFDRFLVLTLQLVFGGVVLLPFFPVYGSYLLTDAWFMLQVLVVALVFTILPLYLNLYALQGLSSSTVGILLYLNPLLNFAVATLWYHEVVDGVQAIAYAFIAISIVVFNKRIIFRRRSS